MFCLAILKVKTSQAQRERKKERKGDFWYIWQWLLKKIKDYINVIVVLTEHNNHLNNK